ncbi:thiamine diphosphate-binding protein [Chytridium lagenaria]|nr:thiamine diphosphate-binding protein [Chytridium lagenaria]
MLRAFTRPPRVARKLPLFVRTYHYDSDVYGYRTPQEFPVVDFTPTQLNNRAVGSNLVRLVNSYRLYGHRLASLDPLNLTPTGTPGSAPELEIERYRLSEGDTFKLDGILTMGGKEEATVKEVVDHLKGTYTGRIGFEFSHMPNLTERRFLNKLVESRDQTSQTPAELKRMMSLLTKSEVFDHFMAKKFPQVKRYGLEGAEGMMVALDAVFRSASGSGIRDIVLGMPHRGRLNLLTDLLQYNPTALFHKVKGNPEFPNATLPGSGDVLSHLATSVDLHHPESKHPIHVSLLHNPSHLEAINPVAVGKARARQMHMYENSPDTAGCFIGDRVVTETLGLSALPHFTAGGSLHLIVNNQIGYTTPAMNARSTVYTSDIAKMINAPVIHVNADYPEDVEYAVRVATAYRMRFRKDVVIDLIAYRRMGHNELDEPSFTQPLMYKTIRSRRSVPVLFEERLMAENVVTKQEIDELRTNYFAKLEKHLEDCYGFEPEADTMKGKWSKMILPTVAVSKLDTGVNAETLTEVGLKSVEAHGITIHNRLAKFHVENRKNKIKSFPVRISGQDVGRGTFSQRHVMLVDQTTERTILPLNRLRDQQPAHLEIATPRLLCDTKFDYSDPTPDNPNMHVVNPTIPRNTSTSSVMHRNFRKPLIVVGPKTLLRHPSAVSSLADMTPGTGFQPVVFVSGKLFYDVEKERVAKGITSMAVVRLEEVAPFPWEDVKEVVEGFGNAKEFIWLQEEPQNQGCYTFVAPRIEQLLPEGLRLKYIGRKPLAACATGISTEYKKEQAKLLTDLFA